MGRRSVWSDLSVLAFAEHFLPVADEVWRLQRGTDAECRTFQAMADAGHYRGKGGTRQGIYVCTPSGRLLSSINSNDPLRVLETLKQGWKKWNALSEEEQRAFSKEALEASHRWEENFPDRGLVLETACRDLTEERVPGERWNRDHAWFAAEEVALWLPETTAVGTKWRLPDSIIQRLARFHLVDNVRGQSVPFAPAEIERAELTGSVERVDGATLVLSFRGATRAHAPGPWQMKDTSFRPKSGREYVHGVETRLAGYATFDREAERFTEFVLAARGERWGHTENNGRRTQTAASPVGYAFRLAPKTPAARVAPAFVQVYDAAWIRRP